VKLFGVLFRTSTNCTVVSGRNVTVFSTSGRDCSFEVEMPGTSQLYRTWLICWFQF